MAFQSKGSTSVTSLLNVKIDYKSGGAEDMFFANRDLALTPHFGTTLCRIQHLKKYVYIFIKCLQILKLLGNLFFKCDQL